MNALTFDVEDWYQVSNLDSLIGFHNWHRCEHRLESSVNRILALLRDFQVKATFFVLGWNAERFPGVIERIAADGHEIGTHGYRHALVYDQTAGEFAADMEKAILALQRIVPDSCKGHRAASFSITRRSWWALETLARLGIAYDSSIFPIRHDRYGVPESERFPHRIPVNGTHILEFPISTLRSFGKNVPFSGGGYFRVLPYRVIATGIRSLNRKGQPAIVYLHPWEFDPQQPRVSAMSRARQFRCYAGIKHTEAKLRTLLGEFAFAPAGDVLRRTFGNHTPGG